MSDAAWGRLPPLVPPSTPGRRRKDDRLVVNGILWKLTTGARWRALPERYGPWASGSTRFRRWTQAGVWDRLFAAVPRQADAAGQRDWAVHCVDGTVVRAHQHAAGAKGGSGGRSAGPQPGWVQHAGPPPGGGRRPADDPDPDAGAAPRGDRL